MQSPTATKFINHWGEMGTRWGINRTVAQVHALLILSERPLNAEQIAEDLSVARSNVSNSLRELQNWRLIRTVFVPGDRSAFYEASGDVWEMFRLILDERKRREIDPTLAILNECKEAAESDSDLTDFARARLLEMKSFFETGVTFLDSLKKVSTPALRNFAQLGERIVRVIGGRGK